MTMRYFVEEKKRKHKMIEVPVQLTMKIEFTKCWANGFIAALHSIPLRICDAFKVRLQKEIPTILWMFKNNKSV